MSFNLVGKAVKYLRLPTVNYSNSPIKIISAQVGDTNSRYFRISIYDDQGDISLKEYRKVTLNATLPDETIQIAEGEIDSESNVAICKIAGSMLKQSGKVACDITFIGKDSNGGNVSLTSQTFYVFVANSQCSDEAIEGSDDYTLLIKLLNEVSDIESSITAAEAQRVSAEEERVANESARQSNESARESSESARIAAEENREEAENTRETAETARNDSETKRNAAEDLRVSSENARSSAENVRISNESTRKNNETARQNAEQSRAAAEAQRVSAEEERVAEYGEISTELGTAIENINAAAENAQKIQEIYNKMAITFFYDEDGYVCYDDKTAEAN